jgi:hypothetical protein
MSPPIEVLRTPPPGWPRCPGCGELAQAVLGGVTAACGNDDCQVFLWDELGREGTVVRIVVE